MPDGHLVLVFDDGYAADYEQLLPVLRAHGAPAAVAVVPEWLGDDDHLTVDQLAALAEADCEICSHGSRHRYLQAHHLAADVTPGEERVTVAAGHVFPGEEHGVLAGDRYEVTDGDRTTTVTLGEPLAVGEETVTLGIEREIDAAFDGEEAVLRPTEATLRDEIAGVRSAFDRLGYDPDAFVFPYDAADPRAWALAAETYDVLPNAAVRSLPNRPDTAPTSYQRCYLERSHLRRAEIETYLDSVATQGGLGILAGHSAWETVPPERVAFVIEAARQRGIEVTTFSGL
ncbi:MULTISPECIES: polysaccharide deacetylase family protein [Halomicrobium]|uniref:Polysaccharide deacetylase n=2 Tax=Halomicrobium mukohataei TaxID=57705 RepID=C7P0N8_HALMD|nr:MULTISPECIES: polysaccharide deacetylase family protein [Halomicrobium]ACV47020.1 polysaccharide deacetylase [Halomicrobium mukohataei DSM 12286]QCD65512.1 DUF2334 domain-containing protein [Halomicrobium mukohataei]QFR20318.1 polysaccharide deacetylase family protein [Halomicrobium sp. ZPS1]